MGTRLLVVVSNESSHDLEKQRLRQEDGRHELVRLNLPPLSALRRTEDVVVPADDCGGRAPVQSAEKFPLVPLKDQFFHEQIFVQDGVADLVRQR